MNFVEVHLLQTWIARHVESTERSCLTKRWEYDIEHCLRNAKATEIHVNQLLVVLDDVLNALCEVHLRFWRLLLL